MEIQSSVDQHARPALALIGPLPELLARQGSVVATWRATGD